MSKKIAIIQCHPNPASFNFGIAEAYKSGAISSGSEVKEIVIANLKFELNLKHGYQKRMELEPDLVEAWNIIQWADHLVWIHPVWWGGLPAMAKGFIDRLFLPGMAFKYRENSVWWDKLLVGKTAHIISTMDQPGWYYWLMFGRPSVNQLKRSTLEFCGIKTKKVTYIQPIKRSTPAQREKWLKKVKEMGRNFS